MLNQKLLLSVLNEFFIFYQHITPFEICINYHQSTVISGRDWTKILKNIKLIHFYWIKSHLLTNISITFVNWKNDQRNKELDTLNEEKQSMK
jgi:hypothetical protein